MAEPAPDSWAEEQPDLVTGASGFIGAHLALALAARGRRVRGLAHRAPLPGPLRRAGVEEVRGDLADAPSLQAAMAGAGRVFHCAALVADWGAPAAFRAANVDGTANLLAAAAATRPGRLIHFSTTDVYGHPDAPVDEGAPFVRRGWPYGDTKIEAELLVWSFARASGVPVTVIRPASVYGPGSQSFVGEIAARLRRRQLPYLGRRQRPAGLCHVDDLVDCVLLAAASADAAGQAYNVTGGEGTSWREFIDCLAGALGVARPGVTLPRPVARAASWALERAGAALPGRPRPPLTRLAVELFTTDQSFSIRKARRELAYEPRRTLADAMPGLVRWLEGGPPC